MSMTLKIGKLGSEKLNRVDQHLLGSNPRSSWILNLRSTADVVEVPSSAAEHHIDPLISE